MSARTALNGAFLPSIPASRVKTTVNDRKPLLFWVRTGRAEFDVDGRTRLLSAGEAIWVPAGVAHRITIEAGSVVFPIFPSTADLPAALNRVLELTIPTAWSDWLILQFAHGLGYLRGSVANATGLLELAAGSRANPATPAGSIAHGPVPPPLPHSPAALEVARVLLRSPGEPTELAEFAQLLQVGARTIQRQFANETGMPFVRWRAAARVAAAATHLDAGRDIGWVSHHVGFGTPAGFTRAFREHTGRTPLDYTGSRHTDRPREERSLGTEIAMLCGLGTGPGPGPGPGATAPPAPPIPATSTWACVNDFHVVVWVHRGTARVTIGKRTWRLRRSDAIWLPAGMHNHIDIDAGSLLLPLGVRSGTSPATAPRPRVVHFPLAAEDWLLHTVVANYTLVRPEDFDGQVVLHQVREASQPRPVPLSSGTAVEGAVERILAAASASPGDARSLADWARTLDVEMTVLHEQFAETTGQTFPNWRAGLRMTLARELLDDGTPPGEVGRHLGYTHPSGFSQVFTKAHGMPPRTYQRRHLQSKAQTDS